MVKLLLREPLSEEQKQAVIRELYRKCRIYATGASKRGKVSHEGFFMALPNLIKEGRLKDETDLLPYILD
jgi:hypothetical protein